MDSTALKSALEELFSSIQERDFLVYLLTKILIRQGQYLSGQVSLIVTELLLHVNEAKTVPEITALFFRNFDTFFPAASVSAYKPFIEKLLAYTEEHLSDPNLSLK